MIEGIDAAKTAETFLGTPYEQMDCNKLIIETIRNAPGGDPNYRCQGTNWLYNSYNNSGKYQYLTERYDLTDNNYGIGQLLFAYNRTTNDAYHVGLIVGKDRVIHSPGKGKVVEIKAIKGSNFNVVGTSKFILPTPIDGNLGQPEHNTEIIYRIDKIIEELEKIKEEL